MDPSSLIDRMDDDGWVNLAAEKNPSSAGKKRKRPEQLIKAPRIPEFPHNKALLKDMYSSFHVLHCSPSEKKCTSFTWKSIQTLFGSLKDDVESWSIETKIDDDDNAKDPVTPHDFLDPNLRTQKPGYCSFLLQKDLAVFQETLPQLPLDQVCTDWSHGDCLWFFFGRNSSSTNTDLAGRPEHTDSVSHDGTWHFQLSGTKRWYLRPTIELVQLLESEGQESLLDPKHFLCVDCHEGDILIVNTRLWWHRTEIPVQTVPSVSYARDFFFAAEGEQGSDQKSNMTNVDGMYAATDIEQGTIIFREDDIPDCELHRSNNPNCEVVMLDENDTYGVVSIRNITAGEFFCVAESDDEHSREDDDGDDDMEEEEDFEDDSDGE